MNFALDGGLICERQSDELHANADAQQTIPDFAPSLNGMICSGQAERKFQDRAFGEIGRSIYEHSCGTDIGRMNRENFAPALIAERQIL